MATTKKANDQNANSSDPKFKGFINYTPTESDKRAFDAARKSSDIVGTALSRVLESGHKLSLVWVERNACYSATLFCKDQSSAYAGWCLSVRAGDPITALERVVWLHYYHLKENWDNNVVDGGQGDIW